MESLQLVTAFICLLVFPGVHSAKFVREDNRDYKGCSGSEAVSRNIVRSDLSSPIIMNHNLTSSITTSNFLKRVTDTCSCVNVPLDVIQIDIWSMNSHGKELLAYFEPNCLQKRQKPWYTVDRYCKNKITSFEFAQFGAYNKYKIYLFGPDPNSTIFKTTCNKIANTAIMGVEMLETDGKLTKQLDLVNTGIHDDQRVIQLLRQSNNRIHFFAHSNFHDFILASEYTASCSNIEPKNLNFKVTSDIRSIITSECVMIFSESNCLGRSTKILSPGARDLEIYWESTVTGSNTLSTLYKSFPSWIWTTKSFRSCKYNKDNKGLNVDITDFNNNLNEHFKQQVFESHKNVCSCENIPRHVRNMDRWSVNNHDASMLAYFEENCESNLFSPLWIPAGRSSYSIALGAFHQFNELTDDWSRILSFGPDYDSIYFKTNCIKLCATIVKFEILTQNFTEENLEMRAPQTIFRNYSPSPQSETFTASRTVRDLFSVDIGTSLQKMQRVNLDSSFEVENKMASNSSESTSKDMSVEANISGSISGPWKLFGVSLSSSITGSLGHGHQSSFFTSNENVLKEGLRKAYQSESITKKSSNVVKVLENTRSETVSRKLTIPACSEQIVHAYVKTVKSRNIEYRALAKINGVIGSGKMNYVEVQKFMDDGMQFATVYDKESILAYSTTGSIKVEYGVTAVFSIKTNPIPECIQEHKLSGCSTSTKASLLPFISIIVHSVVSFLLKL